MSYQQLAPGSRVKVTLEGWVSSSTSRELRLENMDGSVTMQFVIPEIVPFGSETLIAAPKVGDLGVARVRGNKTVVQFRETAEDSYEYAWLDAMGEECSPERVTPVTPEALTALLSAPAVKPKAKS